MADWYYARNNQQVGPVSDDDMHRLAEEGQLRPGDLVWRDGLAEWVPAESQGFAGGRSARGPGGEDDYDRPRRSRDERDDDYRPRRRTAKKKGPSTGLIVGLSVGGVLLLIGIIVGVVLLVNSGGGGSRGGNVGPGTYHGVLGPGDPRDKQLRGSPCHTYNVQMTAGRTYIIDHMSDRFDCFLRLEDPAGRQLMVDDDGGIGLNSKIIFRPPGNGQYRVFATSLSGRGGPYTLTIVEN